MGHRGTNSCCLHPVPFLLCKEDVGHYSVYTSIGDHKETRQKNIMQPSEMRLLQLIPHLPVAHWVVLNHKPKTQLILSYTAIPGSSIPQQNICTFLAEQYFKSIYGLINVYNYFAFDSFNENFLSLNTYKSQKLPPFCGTGTCHCSHFAELKNRCIDPKGCGSVLPYM